MNVFVIHEFLYRVICFISLSSNEHQLLSVESQGKSSSHFAKCSFDTSFPAAFVLVWEMKLDAISWLFVIMSGFYSEQDLFILPINYLILIYVMTLPVSQMK